MQEPDTDLAATYSALQLDEGELLIRAVVFADEPPLTKKLVNLGRLFWVSATHAESGDRWNLDLRSAGNARFDMNPVDVLEELVRVKGGKIPEYLQNGLEALRGFLDREFSATGPTFRSEGPKLPPRKE